MDVKEFCFEWVSFHDVQLYLRDQSLTPIEAFSETGLLPAIAQRADQLAMLTLGYGIGLVLEDTKESTLGVRVDFDDTTPRLVRIACLLHVLENLRSSATDGAGHLVLDELLYD